MNRLCAGGCGRVTDKRRCPACARHYEAQRGPRRMTGRYDTAYRKLRAQALREHPWCVVCRAPDSPDNPLTADHIVPLALGGRNVRDNVQVMCRACNSRKGARPQLLTHP